MYITQIAENSWQVQFEANWVFVQYMWRALLENDRGIVTLENLKNLSVNIRKEPLSEFQNNPALKATICKECEQLYKNVGSLPQGLKQSKFILTVDHSKKNLILSKL